MSALEPAKVKISTGPYGLTGLEVNGEDWTKHVRTVRMSASGDSVPVFEVEMVAEGLDMEGPGIMVVQAAAGDTRAAILAFLDSVDVRYLEARSLDGDFNESPGEGFIRAMKDMVAE